MEKFNATWAVRAARGLTRGQMVVLYAIAAHCNCKRSSPNWAQAGMKTLADEAGLSRNGAQGIVKQLEAIGWLKVKRQKREKNRDAPNEYWIIPPWGMTNKPPEGWANSVGPVGQAAGHTQGQAAGHEVKKILKLTKEVTKNVLTTPPRLEGQNQNQHPAAKLAEWMRATGTEVEVAALLRDQSTGEEKGGVRLIQPGEARAANRAGHCIFIRPKRGDAQTCIMLDDLDTAAVADITSRWRCAVVETSADNYQAWIALTRPATEDERKRVQRVVGAGYGADRGSNSGDHYGRCPGFVNNKPGRAKFVSRLSQAAERGKLLDVDAVLRQEPAAPVTRYQSARAALTFPRRPASAHRTSQAGGDSSESGREWGWVMGSLESGMSPTEVEARLAEHAETRRGKDATRYAAQTVGAALKKVSARAA
jgi:hypothetical protein